jgi:guanine nucleotide-binding protein subunit alpha
MLLGQAESGKSTLQKQFQLYYSSQSLNHERPSWIPIVHFNIVKAVRMILDELDYDFARPRDAVPDEESLEHPVQAQQEIALLRTRLLTLIAMEDSFASELNGGVSISGGKTGLFVRAGWQALVTPSQSWPRPTARSMQPSVTATLAARTLGTMQEEIESLWRHPATKRLLRLRKLRLDESAPLYVCFYFFDKTLIGGSFLDNLYRITETEYMPSTGTCQSAFIPTLLITPQTTSSTSGCKHWG